MSTPTIASQNAESLTALTQLAHRINVSCQRSKSGKARVTILAQNRDLWLRGFAQRKRQSIRPRTLKLSPKKLALLKHNLGKFKPKDASKPIMYLVEIK